MSEMERWYAIPESLLVRVMQMLMRPSGEVIEIIELLKRLPPTKIEEESHEQHIGFAPEDD